MTRVITNPAIRFMFGVTLACAILLALGSVLFHSAVLDHSWPVKDLRGEIISIEKHPNGSRLMTVEWTGTRQRHCAGRTSRWLIDGYTLPLSSSDVPPYDNAGEKIGDPVRRRVLIEVPASFPAHKGIYQVVTTYRCNTIQSMFPDLLAFDVKPAGVPFDLTGEEK